MVKIINKISNLILPECKVLCEPQLGKEDYILARN